MRLDKKSSTPLYVQMQEILVARIKKGTYVAGALMPSENALCQEFNTSRPTVRQAMANLAADGYVVIEKGRGTYVKVQPERYLLRNFDALACSLLGPSTLCKLTKITDEIEAKPNLDEASKPVTNLRSSNISWRLDNRPNHTSFGNQGKPLPFVYQDVQLVNHLEKIDQQFELQGELHPGFWSVTRSLSMEDTPLVVSTSYVQVAMFPELAQSISSGKRILDITSNKYAYIPQKGSLQLSLRSAQADVAEILDVSARSQVLYLEGVLRARNGRVTEVLEIAIRPDLVEIELGS